jgi:hypothetical protein
MAGNLFLSTTFASGTASTGAATREALSIGPMFSGALLKIYAVTQATNADTALGAQTLLATLTFHATTPLTWAHTAGTSIVGTAGAITSESNATAGTAAWFRLTNSAGTIVILDGNVSTSTANLNLNSTAISAGATVSITSFTFTIPVNNTA